MARLSRIVTSARSHLAGRRMAGDPLTNVAAIGAHVRNWKARLRAGRPLAAEEWIAAQEQELDRKIASARRGRKPVAKGEGGLEKLV